MFKKRSLQVKVVRDSDLDDPCDYVTINAHEVSDAVIDVVKESANTVVKIMFVYMALDTYRKVAIALASR